MGMGMAIADIGMEMRMGTRMVMGMADAVYGIGEVAQMAGDGCAHIDLIISCGSFILSEL